MPAARLFLLGRPGNALVCPVGSQGLRGNELIPAASHANGWRELQLLEADVLSLSPRTLCSTLFMTKGPSRNVRGEGAFHNLFGF